MNASTMQLEDVPPPLPWELGGFETSCSSTTERLMAWGHASAFAGGVGGIAGGFALVALGGLSPVVGALLFAAPIGGAFASVALYAGAWLFDWRASRRGLASRAVHSR